jgi:hypothetical protein
VAAPAEVAPPSGADPGRFARAIAAIDAANAGDPATVVVDGVVRPKEQAHAEAMVHWVRTFDPEADEAQLLAARANHLRRWAFPRDAEPEGRAGYLRWRAEAKRRHAAEVGEILATTGYEPSTIERVQELVAKKGLGRGDRPDVDGRPDPFQVHEDALCLVFLTTQFDDLVAKLGDDRTVDVLARTLSKMGDRGRAAALALDLSDRQRTLVAAALERLDAVPVDAASVGADDALDSLLSMPADITEEPAEEPSPGVSSAPRLTVEPGSVGPSTDLGGGSVPVTSFWAESWPVDDDGSAVPAPLPAPEAEPTAVAQVSAGPPLPAPAPSVPLPRRTPLAETAPQWGPRDHPPAVLAPSPPHPLDAPAVARVKRSSGTGLPSGMAAGGPAPVPSVPRVPTPPSVPEAMSTPVPERPTHPRVRRWFGRGVEPDGEVEGEPESEAEVAPPRPSDPPQGAFGGAPDGMLVDIVPEDDLGPGVHDLHGIEAAMSRLSAGAHRSALAPLAVVAALLEPGEVAEAVVQGEYQHRPAVVVLTDRRVVVANDRRWAPDVRTFGFTHGLGVHGWQDDRRATLVFGLHGVGVVVDAISDRPLARDLAQRVRARCGGGPSAVEPGS